jgi:hypothetical protein
LNPLTKAGLEMALLFVSFKRKCSADLTQLGQRLVGAMFNEERFMLFENFV